ncbi:hypothetical protein [Flammeovirga kamogawensis]|uniref:RHS repeat protein n=1 Tax=Flammeovirga kamogawensis TaxID=373891 RepID=A0ABX8H5K7_9BACT|nr:hypothetical protein [Flammeovirga kamogawensis]MBB6461785.1 hypothetical protein [Flammeovirga kamogawensis]QWG10701.1 hypothetical protein KM029_25290 [Flammeovirga kamogawensis]TRX63803.1 hypothetical protein EO216_25660 [Flammeovirga kamogawensis]
MKETGQKTSSIHGDVYKIIEKQYQGSELFDSYKIDYSDDKSYTSYWLQKKNLFYKSELTNTKGNTEWRTESSYNSNGEILETTIYHNNNVESKFVNTIENNKVVETATYNSEGEIDYTEFKTYNKGDLSNVRRVDTVGKVLSTSDYIRKDGEVIMVTVKDSLDKIKVIKRYERNDKGELVKQTTEKPQNKNTSIVNFKYDYDAKGNWIRKYIFDKNYEIDNIQVRYITYSNDLNDKKINLIGKWFVFGTKEEWFIFNKDNTVTVGRGEKGNSFSGLWEVDKEKQIITIKESTDKADELVLHYTVEGALIKLEYQNLEKIMFLERREKVFYKEETKEEFAFRKWFITGEENRWIEFKRDSTFEILEDGNFVGFGQWSLDKEQNTISLNDEIQKENLKYTYKFTKKHLIFFTNEGAEAMKLVAQQ